MRTLRYSDGWSLASSHSARNRDSSSAPSACSFPAEPELCQPSAPRESKLNQDRHRRPAAGMLSTPRRALIPISSLCESSLLGPCRWKWSPKVPSRARLLRKDPSAHGIAGMPWAGPLCLGVTAVGATQCLESIARTPAEVGRMHGARVVVTLGPG